MRRGDKKVKMRMPPCSVDIIEWTYRSSTGFNKSLAIKSATPVIQNVKLNGFRVKLKGKKIPGYRCHAESAHFLQFVEYLALVGHSEAQGQQVLEFYP